VLAVGWSLAAPGAAAAAADFAAERPSADARHVAQYVIDSGDHERRPFVIVDKKEARIFVFRSNGSLAGASAALVGSTIGDHSVSGVGQRAQQGQVGPHERTTPAGRFLTQPGRNLEGEHVVWVDYATAFAIHRVRPGASHERRLARLASSTPTDNRASLGCVVVPVDFYESVVLPLLGRSRGVVYVMPETRPARDVFGAL
jgi:hypothetical protein